MDFQATINRLVTGNLTQVELEQMQLEALQEFRTQLADISRLEIEAVRTRTLAIILGQQDQVASMDASLRELDSCRQQVNALMVMLTDQMMNRMTPAATTLQ